jgi:hypothetical protein
MIEDQSIRNILLATGEFDETTDSFMIYKNQECSSLDCEALMANRTICGKIIEAIGIRNPIIAFFCVHFRKKMLLGKVSEALKTFEEKANPTKKTKRTVEVISNKSKSKQIDINAATKIFDEAEKLCEFLLETAKVNMSGNVGTTAARSAKPVKMHGRRNFFTIKQQTEEKTLQPAGSDSVQNDYGKCMYALNNAIETSSIAHAAAEDIASSLIKIRGKVPSLHGCSNNKSLYDGMLKDLRGVFEELRACTGYGKTAENARKIDSLGGIERLLTEAETELNDRVKKK